MEAANVCTVEARVAVVTVSARVGADSTAVVGLAAVVTDCAGITTGGNACDALAIVAPVNRLVTTRAKS